MFINRLKKEAKNAATFYDSTFLLTPHSNDLLKWKCFINGPKNTPFEQGIFEVKIDINNHYPLEPPKVFFKTKIFHPNIHPQNGQVCLDIIKQKWTPNWTIEGIMRAIICLLQEPNAQSPLNCDAGNLLRNNQVQSFKSMARLYTSQYSISKKQFEQQVQKFEKKDK